MFTGKDVVAGAGELPLRDRLMIAVTMIERSTAEKSLTGSDRVRLLLALSLMCSVSERARGKAGASSRVV